jgi:hypothetical protein
MFELLTQPSSMVLEIANVRSIILLMPDDNYTDWEITENECEDLGVTTMSSNI